MTPKAKSIGKRQARSEFAPRLLAWAEKHGRSGLPWQGGSPYEVWVSEIMLQQTRVETVIGYFRRFLARFPTLESLADSREEDVLAAWSGLGYYQRAKNLRAAAQAAMRDCGGALPKKAADLMKLPGIGRSTAAAIASSCHNERVAILDANAKRALARAFAVKEDLKSAAGMAKLWRLAESLVPEDASGYTQAIMDLGATVCLPKPRCEACPMAEICQGKSAPEKYPGRAEAAKKKERAERAEIWLLAHDGQRVALCKRPSAAGVWRGMLALPLSEGEPSGNWTAREGIRHDFSHYRLFAALREKKMRPKDLERWAEQSSDRVLMPIEEALRSAIPSPVRGVLESFPQ